MAKTQRKHVRELRIVLDTNVVFTGTAHYLLRQEVSEFIHVNASPADLSLIWYLPEMVMLERKHQMFSKAKELKPSIEKLEKLLGHNLAISDEVLQTRVNEAIDRHIKETPLVVCPLDVSKVDWTRLLQDAVCRVPPFDPGEKEKGFRDAIVIETFLQIVSASPTTPRTCMVALVSNDDLVCEAARRRTQNIANVRIHRTLEEVQELISTLASQVDEAFLNRVSQQASELFYTKDDRNSVFIREKIRDRIESGFTDELTAKPERSESRQNGQWAISRPRFLKKVAQRIHWTSRITIEAKAYAKKQAPADNTHTSSWLELLNRPPDIQTSATSRSPWDFLNSLAAGPKSSYQSALRAILAKEDAEQFTLVGQGESVFEVEWSVAVTTKQKLTRPKFESVSHVETTWQP
jgi:predicted nucleic acid-binding protein